MYKLEFMDDKEFERLPYPDMEVSLGVADPKLKKAFVRRTGVEILDAFNAMHELEHLEEGKKGEYAHHYENGVYYKKLSEAVQPVLSGALGFLTGGPVGAITGGTAAGLQGRAERKSRERQQQQSQVQQQAPLDSFTGNPGINPNAGSNKPNVVTVGGGQSTGLGGGSVGQQGSVIDRVRGFFSGRV